MKPFLILQLRLNDAVADGELHAFLKYGGLTKNDVHRVRMERESIPKINLNDYSGVIVGGGPSNISDSEEKKPEEQQRFEKELGPLMDSVIKTDFPHLGSCYGFGYLTEHMTKGATSKEKYSEELDAIEQHIRPEGKSDPLLTGLPETFKAISAHKEACQKLPENAVWLIEGKNCPYQMYRIKENIYATQFHTELSAAGAVIRIDIYKHAGYFPPEEAEAIKKHLLAQDVSVPPLILKRFVERYKRN
jgi:GMP synthase (glutamine-hydrolysing)